MQCVPICFPAPPRPPPPLRSVGESWASTLFFINSQSNAAAQATALSLGNTHSSALLVDTASNSDGDHNMYTFGRGELEGARNARQHSVVEGKALEPYLEIGGGK